MGLGIRAFCASLVFLSFVSATAPAPAAAAGPSCKALLKLKDSELPDWYKADLRQRAKVFFRELGDMTSVSAVPNLEGVSPEMKKVATLTWKTMNKKALWREFVVETTIELADRLEDKGLLKEGQWTWDLEDADSTTQQNFVKTKVNPVLRQLIKDKAGEYGFTKFVSIPAGQTTAEAFFGHHRRGEMFWDGVFQDGSHGADTHNLQVLFMAPYIKEEFGKAMVMKFYKYMGSEDGRVIWDSMFDAMNGTTHQPEALGPVLKLLLPRR